MIEEKLRILLLSVSSKTFFYKQLVIPFGLTSLASYIDNEDYEIRGIEMNKPLEKVTKRYLGIDEDLLKDILDFSPNIVAMSTYAANIYNVLFWTKVIKRNLPNCFIIIGGNHASYIARECLEKCPELDIVIRFEGEIPFLELCEKVKNEDYDFSEIPSISYRSNTKIKENPNLELIKDLGTLPILNREYFKISGKNDDHITHADIISARGCPFNCTFCNCNHYWSKRYRIRKVETIIKEISDLQKKYPSLKSLRFRDESISINKNRCIKLCNEIIKNNIKLEFQAHSRIDGLDKEVIKKLSEVGFKKLFIGIESGSTEVLKRLRKGIDLSKVVEVIKLLRKFRIKFKASFICSTRGERLRDTLETIKLIKKLKLSRKKKEFNINYGVSIYPGTLEWEKFSNANPDYEWITKNYNFRNNYKPIKDMKGNILHPIYYEGGYFKDLFRKLLIYILIDPLNFLRTIKFELINLGSQVLKLLSLKKHQKSNSR